MNRSMATVAAIAATLVGTRRSPLAQATLGSPYADLQAASFVTIVRFTNLTFATHRTEASIFGTDSDEELDTLRRRVTESIVARAALRASGFSARDVVAMGSRAGNVYLYVDDLPSR
jgi:hypothetical protein